MKFLNRIILTSIFFPLVASATKIERSAVDFKSSVTISGQTASTVPYLNASKVITSSAVTNTELGYLSGVTSAIQTQLAAKLATADAAGYPYTVQNATTTANINAGTQMVFASTAGGTYTLTPYSAASNSGERIFIQKTTADFTVLTVNSGSLSTTLNTQGESILIVSDGTDWKIVNRSIPSVWTAFTPTGSWSTNTTYTGFWKRDGDSIECRIYIALAGAPTAATLTINIPSGLTIDTAKMTSTDGSDAIFGSALLTDTGTAKYAGALVYSSTTAISTRYFDNSSPVRALGINATTPVTWASTDALSFAFRVPISGWN